MRQSHHGNLENWNLKNFTALESSKNLEEGNEVYKGGVILPQFFKSELLRGEIMNVSQTRRSIRLREWARMVQDRQCRSMTVRAWCQRSGISENRYYYGLNQVRKAVIEGFDPNKPDLEEAPTLVKVDLTNAPSAYPASERQAAAESLPSVEAHVSEEHCLALSASHIRLQYNGGVLDIPTGTNAEAIAEVLKALRIHAV